MSSRRSRMTRTGGSLFAAVARPASSARASSITSATTVPSGFGPSGSEPSGPRDGRGSAGADLTGKVFYLLPNATTPRYTNYDAPEFVAAMAEYAPNVEVVLLNAEGDPQTAGAAGRDGGQPGRPGDRADRRRPEPLERRARRRGRGRRPGDRLRARGARAARSPTSWCSAPMTPASSRPSSSRRRSPTACSRRRSGSPVSTATPATTTTRRCSAGRTRSSSR